MIPPVGPSPRRILIIRLKGIGDVILSTPILRALKKAYPQAELHFLTRAFAAPVLQGNPFLEKTLILPEKKEGLGETLRFLGQLRKNRYDWVLDLAAEPRSAWLTLATGAPLRAGYAFRFREWAFTRRIPKNKIRKYQGEVNLDLVRALGVPDDGNGTELFLNDDERKWAAHAWGVLEEGKRRPLRVGLNPTGAWESKRWPIDDWRRLAAFFYDRMGLKPVLYGGPGDGEGLREIAWGIENKVLIKPETDLRQAAAFIEGMDILIGNDGTPQHLAQALGVKSLTLCGPHWGMSWTKPGDPRHRYLQYFLDCGPCDKNICPFPKGNFGAGHFHQECLVKITPERVFEEACRMTGKI